MWRVLRSRCLHVALVYALAGPAWAGPAAQWLSQLNAASQLHDYAGTMVISVDEQMATAQVAHAIDQGVASDRIEVLTGEPRTTYRRGGEVVTVWPQRQLWVREQRDDLGIFPALTGGQAANVDAHYQLQQLPPDRVAGRKADVVALVPKDAARWAYRIWRDASSGLMLKVQTTSLDGARILEQTAFTSFALQPDWQGQTWMHALPQPEGLTHSELSTRAVLPQQWGLGLVSPIAGFAMQRVQLPQGAQQPSESHPLQWVFSDGLATISVFYQPMNDVPAQSVSERVIRMGATHTLMRQTPDMRVTVVGEAPVDSLRAFADALTVGEPKNDSAR